jgi:hypothetical protein
MNLEAHHDQEPEDMACDYGYDRAVPENEKSQDEPDYGYGGASPDNKADAMDYGYGDAAPDTRDYGHGDAAPYSASSKSNNNTDSPRGARASRRSSMKQAGRVGRRSSIGYTGEVVLQILGQRDPVRRRTSISFDHYDEVAEVEPIKDLTDEPEKLWFQPKEYDMIRAKACLITDLATAGGCDVDDKRLCTRGLEPHIHRDTVLQEQFMAKRSVLVEQAHQRNMGIFDDEVVAKIYQLTSMSSATRASSLAQHDYEVAEKHTRSTRKFLRRSSVF